MKRIARGLAVAAMLAVIPWPAAAATLQEAFDAGEASGHVATYGQQVRYREAAPGESRRSSWASASTSLEYRTAPYYGVGLGFGAWGTTRLYQRSDGDYRDQIEDDAVIHLAYVRYAGEGGSEITVGRQAIDLNWVIDYIYGASARFTTLEEMGLTLGWAERQAVFEFDEVSEKFARINGDKGLYFLELEYRPLEWLRVNPYYYHADDLFRATGMKLAASLGAEAGSGSTTMLQYVSSDTPAGLDNGDFLQAEQIFGEDDYSLGIGYTRAGKNGVGGVASFGDQNPFEEGENIYNADARSWYLFLGFEQDDLKLLARYGKTVYDDGGKSVKETEYNLIGGFGLEENLDLELIFVRVDNSAPSASYIKYGAALVYRF